MDKNQPIGVIDSGVGGLSVLRALQRVLPQETFLYLGDTARAPYGVRSRENITELVAQLTEWMEQQRIKLLVTACNTITVLGTDVIRGNHSFPVIGMSKGVEEVLQATKNKNIGLMATDFTVSTGAHRAEIQAADPAAQVFGVGCTKFVPLIEGNRFGSAELDAAIREYADALKAKNVDTVILGCTHYPFVREYLAEVFGPGVTLVDPAEATARQAKADLEQRGLLKTEGPGSCIIGFTGDLETGKLLAARMLDPATCEFREVVL
ncbi:MAG: glutamate racemase [Acidaminococcaceae bacterium]|nr:glutamate racemase [Acidaminococcaceae bacterium]